jgi:tRNA threonylcarbamoyladenosine biosynthesis protein TsaE
MPVVVSRSPAETEALGERWGREARSGIVIGLSGELGAGKTQLVRGIARGLGCASKVHSPTFTLLNEYSGGRLPLFHLDLYRLGDRDQIFSAGLDEYLDRPEGVAVVEWIERWLGIEPSAFDLQASTSLPPGSLRVVKIEVLNETERRIAYEDAGT